MSGTDKSKEMHLLRCGMIMGMASILDPSVLREIIENPGPDFRYAEHVAAVLALVEAIHHPKEI